MDPSYNNLGGFGSGGVVTPVGSSANDIVLTSKKKSHKGIIIAIVLAVLIIGGLFAVAFLMPKGDGHVDVSNDARLAFNKYANYLLYGNNSDRVLEGEYDENSIYRIDEIRNESTQAITNYFKTANELLVNFESLTNGNTNSDFVTAVNNYRADFELVRLAFNKDYITEENLINEVLSNNIEDVGTWIVNKYDSLTKSDYENVRQYAEAEINYYQLYAEYLEGKKNANCLGLEGNVVCDDYRDDVLEEKIAEAYSTATNYYLTSQNNIIENCWTIEEMMKEGSES